MNFGKAYRTIREAHTGNSLSLAPTATTETRTQLRHLTDRTTNSNGLNIRDPADNLEDHIHISGV